MVPCLAMHHLFDISCSELDKLLLQPQVRHWSIQTATIHRQSHQISGTIFEKRKAPNTGQCVCELDCHKSKLVSVSASDDYMNTTYYYCTAITWPRMGTCKGRKCMQQAFATRWLATTTFLASSPKPGYSIRKKTCISPFPLFFFFFAAIYRFGENFFFFF